MPRFLWPLAAVDEALVQTHQVALGAPVGVLASRHHAADRIWKDVLIIPAYAAVLSIFIALLQILSRSKPVKKLRARFGGGSGTEEPQSVPTSTVVAEPPALGFWSEAKAHVSAHGGTTIWVFHLVRLLATVAFWGLAIATLIVDESERGDSQGSGLAFLDALKKHKRRKHRQRQQEGLFTEPEWLQFALCLVYAYASFLGLFSVFSRPTWSRPATQHLTFILTVTLLVYFYRDIWPLMTYTLSPVDAHEGPLLWAKVAVLTIGGAIVPLFVPRMYRPIDPLNPSAEPAAEQTCSAFSFAMYTFLDPTVFMAYRMPHLPLEKLPPLPDYDYAQTVTKRAFPELDRFSGAKNRHIFWGILSVFRKQWIFLASMLVIRVVTGFASPLGINRLLNYLENRGEGAFVRPWVWIAWLFVGPFIRTIFFQLYIFVSTHMLVRTEGIITQLVFEHALRVRMKAETPPASDSSAESRPTTPSEASGSGSESGSPLSDSPEGSGDETVRDRDSSVARSAASSTTVQASESGASDGASKSGKKGHKKGAPSVAESVKSTSSAGGESATHHADGSAKADNLIGRINNLVTTDLNNLVDGRDWLMLVVGAPLDFAASMWFLYAILGWSVFVGLAVMLLLFPIPGYFANLIQKVQVERMKKTDARVQSVTETMNVLRMIKLFGWEPKVDAQVEEKREEELKWFWKRRLLDLLNSNINYVIPLAHMIATYVTYTVIMKRDLSASLVFSSMAVFDILRGQLFMVFGFTPMIIQAKVSLDRVDDFLRNTELLDAYTHPSNETAVEAITVSAAPPSDVIGFKDATFAWSAEATSDGTLTPSKRNFRLRVEDELLFKRGVNLIIGPTGSGKTSLLMALLGEMHFMPRGPESWFALPRDGGVAYAAQESWVQNETIKANILFGAPLDEARYKKVIYQCGLKRDLTLFDAGDETEVGEKGLTLSGGQKARITLARAVYSSAEILLLDDILAALDVHTAKWIVDKLFKSSSSLVAGRTVLLVTHNIAMASPIADFVVSLSSDGRILSQGSVSDALSKNKILRQEMAETEKALEQAEEEIDSEEDPDAPAKKADGKLVAAEEIEEGHVGLPALKLYAAALGGNWAVTFWFCMLAAFLICELFNVVETWFLGYWAAQYELVSDPTDVKVGYYLTVFSLLLVISIICYAVGYTLYVFGSLRASRSIHKKLIESILGTTLRWLDMTPTSRVIARCTQDIRAIDGNVADYLAAVIDITVQMLTKLGAVVVFTPVFLIPGVGIAIVGVWLGNIYIKAQLSVKREMSNARSPVLGHFGAAIAGLTSIRAYGAQAVFKRESLNRIDRYTRAARSFYNLNRWICVRIDFLGAAFSAGLATYLVYWHKSSAANTGFSLTMAVGFSGMILWWVRCLNEFEVSGNSLERIQGYLQIEQEPKPTEGGVPPAYWPASGDLIVENLYARYSSDGPQILKNINFHIKSGERVGVVGRTGSGKSSLTLSLLRCILTEGNVYYDGLPTASLNLDALRSKITIIPQTPELLSGSLRQNLDPFSQHDDAELNDALRAAGLFSLQANMEEGRLTLDSPISSGGGNLSVGQRQILALARAIVRRSKLLILDEATSAIDYETDTIIQASLRSELKDDVTVITVAHRLQTIMDADKIIVLDGGELKEFASPAELLKDEHGLLRSLVDESGDREQLYKMANARASSASS